MTGSESPAWSAFRPRPVAFHGLWSSGDWRMKVYSMLAPERRFEPDLLDRAKRLARRRLPRRAPEPPDPAVGYLLAHQGLEGDYVSVNWWVGDVVQHHLYGAKLGERSFRFSRSTGAGFCTQELAILWHERDAWIETYLSRPSPDAIDEYLARGLQGIGVQTIRDRMV